MVVGKLARGAISLTGNLLAPVKEQSSAETVPVPLTVVALEKLAGNEHGRLLPPGMAAVNDRQPELAGRLTPTCFMELSSGSDCVLSVQGSQHVPEGCIALEEAHRYSLHLAEDTRVSFHTFLPPADKAEPFALTDLAAEVRLRASADKDKEEQEQEEEEAAAAVRVDADTVSRMLAKASFGRILAVGQTVAIPWEGGRTLLALVTAANNLEADEQADRVVYHCYRGLVTADTRVDVAAVANAGTAAGLELFNVRAPCIVGQSRTGHLVHITTCDEEWFPVKKKLLRPCIALTRAVQDKGDVAVELSVDVDCPTFDKVLLFLEAEALGRAHEFNVDINLVDDLLQAARTLGCQPLEDVCLRLLGDFESRIREYTFSEVKEANASGKVWIMVDFMVLDVTRWLPEHPGGKTIIPGQALNVDATCFFELYHVSRESFMYLKQFYIGELCEEDRAAVPSDVAASEHFMQQLREYTTFRIATKPLIQTFKSF